jgi:D-serine deaminase-like pyridoxal phosphate-dependent protein
MDEREPAGHWIRFEDVDGRTVEDPTFVPALPEVGQLIPVAGTHCEVMEQWTDRSLVEGGGPEVIVFTVKPLV